MPDRGEFLALALAFAAVGVAVSVITRFLARSYGATSFPRQKCRALPWDGFFVLAAFCTSYMIMQLAGMIAAQFDFGFEKQSDASRVASLCLGGLAALPVQLGLLSFAVAILGLPTYHLRFGDMQRSIRLGVYGWFLISGMTYLVNFLVLMGYQWFTGHQPDEHPILNVIKTHQSHWIAVLLLLESTIVAPIREEILFRGILQNWLVHQPNGGMIGLAIACLIGLILPHSRDGLPPEGLLAAPFAVSLVPVLALLESWSRGGMSLLLPIIGNEQRRRAIGGIVGSAAVFANFHATVWPTPIPLFVFGLGVGWLAYRTQSLGPSLIVHMLFNLTATIGIFLR